MHKRSILGLFCEDIREEAGEQFTLIGLMSDNLSINPIKVDKSTPQQNASAIGKMLSQVCIFVRVNIDPTDPLEEISLRISFPDGTSLPIGGAEAHIVAKAKADAIEKGNPLAGIIMRAALQGFRPLQGGLIKLEADLDSETQLLAAMNMEVNEVTSSSESGQPS